MDSNNRYYTVEGGKCIPTSRTRRGKNSDIIASATDAQLRPKQPPTQGARVQFLNKYEEIRIKERKTEIKTAFKSAMELIRSAFNPTAFTPIMCLGWIGINAKEEILEAYLKKLSMEDALERAREINDSINFEAISEDEVTSIIETEKGKLKETEGTKREDDDGR